MIDQAHVAATVAVAAGVTVALRTVPFAVLAPLRRSALLQHLGAATPVAIVAVLAVYVLRDVDLGDARVGGPQVATLLLVVGLYRWRPNPSLAIVAGTAFYVGLVNLVPGLAA